MIRIKNIAAALDDEHSRYYDALYRQRRNNIFVDDTYTPPEHRWTFVVADGVIESSRASFLPEMDALKVLCDMHSPTLPPSLNVAIGAMCNGVKPGVLLFNTRQNYRFECVVPDTFVETEGDWIHADGVLGLRTSHIRRLTLKECKIMTNTY